jgi:phage-related protein
MEHPSGWIRFFDSAYNIHSEGWVSFAADNLPSIIWQGNEYDPHPYEVTGWNCLALDHSQRRLFL